MSDILTALQGLLADFILPGLGALAIGAAWKLARVWAAGIEDDRLRGIIGDLVRSAEQIYGPGRGDDKRRYVLASLEQIPAQQTTGPTERARIEAAVHALSAEGPQVLNVSVDELLDGEDLAGLVGMPTE